MKCIHSLIIEFQKTTNIEKLKRNRRERKRGVGGIDSCAYKKDLETVLISIYMRTFDLNFKDAHLRRNNLQKMKPWHCLYYLQHVAGPRTHDRNGIDFLVKFSQHQGRFRGKQINRLLDVDIWYTGKTLFEFLSNCN